MGPLLLLERDSGVRYSFAMSFVVWPGAARDGGIVVEEGSWEIGVGSSEDATKRGSTSS